MAYPKKRKSFRQIVVDNQQFRWRVTSQLQNLSNALGWNSTLTLQGAESSGQQFVVSLFDEPVAITPQFVSKTIRFGLENGWRPAERDATLRTTYRDAEFVTK